MIKSLTMVNRQAAQQTIAIQTSAGKGFFAAMASTARSFGRNASSAMATAVIMPPVRTCLFLMK